MKKASALALFVCLLASPCLAQSSTSTGVGVGVAASRSQSAAVAISGQGGQGGTASGNGTSSSALTINSAAQPAVTTSNVNQNVSGTQTVKNVPPAYAPGLAAAGLETCLGSISGGGAFVGTGFSFGTTIPDPGCAARLDARTLWSMGLKSAAVARLCLNGDIYRSMPDICARYAPQPPQGYAGAYASAQPIVLSTNPTGTIDVIEGKTGRTRPCSDYDEAKQKCSMWADAPHKIRVAAHRKPKTAREAINTAIKPSAPAPAVVDPPSSAAVEETKEH